MTRNAHGRKSKARQPADDGPGRPIHDMRRAYKRPRVEEEWQHDLGDEEIEELEDFDELTKIEDSELGVPEELMEPEEKEHQ